MHVHVGGLFVAELVCGKLYDAPVIVVGFESSAEIRIDMPEIEAGIQPFVESAKIENLFHSPYLPQFAHRFGANYAVVQIVAELLAQFLHK